MLIEEDFLPVEFKNQFHPKIKICPKYYELGWSEGSQVYGRQGVLRRIIAVAERLPKTIGLLVWDVYRPRGVQAQLFEWMKGEIKKRHPEYSQTTIEELAKHYMSPPSKVGDEYCPPHLSGGAIDLTLYDLTHERPLAMGTEFDDFTPKAHRDYYQNQQVLDSEERLILERRALMCQEMEAAGFTSYAYEWWHFDIGNLFWSQQTGLQAVFGPLFGDEEWPKPGVLSSP